MRHATENGAVEKPGQVYDPRKEKSWIASKLFWKKLDGNRPPKLRIGSLIHLAHTARSKVTSDLVMCEFSSDHA